MPKSKNKDSQLLNFLFITDFLTRVGPSEITSAPDVLEQPHEQGTVRLYMYKNLSSVYFYVHLTVVLLTYFLFSTN